MFTHPDDPRSVAHYRHFFPPGTRLRRSRWLPPCPARRAARLTPSAALMADVGALDWWRVPIGGGVSHVCPYCVDAVIGEHDDGSECTGLDALADMGAWAVPVGDVVGMDDVCDVCGSVAYLPECGSR